MLFAHSVSFGSVVLVFCLTVPTYGEKVLRVDQRPEVEQTESSEYFLVFCARNSSNWGSGHAFVVWFQRDNVSGAEHAVAFGFYPEDEHAIAALIVGSGKVTDESTKNASNKPHMLTHRFIVQVNRTAFCKSLAMKKHWALQGYNYNIFHRNCAHFAFTVADASGIKLPKPNFAERPAKYLDRIMQTAKQAHAPLGQVLTR